MARRFRKYQGRGDPMRNCQRKLRYTEPEARARAAHKGIRSYCCPVCGGWHLTGRIR